MISLLTVPAGLIMWLIKSFLFFPANIVSILFLTERKNAVFTGMLSHISPNTIGTMIISIIILNMVPPYTIPFLITHHYLPKMLIVFLGIKILSVIFMATLIRMAGNHCIKSVPLAFLYRIYTKCIGDFFNSGITPDAVFRLDMFEKRISDRATKYVTRVTNYDDY